MQTGLHSLWKVHLWVSESPSSCSSSLLQDLGYVVLSLHVVVQGNVSRYTGSSWSPRDTQSQETTLLRPFSIRPSEKWKSVTQRSRPQFSSKHLPRVRVWLGRSPHSSSSSAAIFLRQASQRVSSPTPDLVADPFLHSRPHDGPDPVLHLFRPQGYFLW